MVSERNDSTPPPALLVGGALCPEAFYTAEQADVAVSNGRKMAGFIV
jgi:hypothetical protein